MKGRIRYYSFLLVGLALLLVGSVTSCRLNPRYVYENGAIEVGGDGEPIELINNPDATDPSYAELVAFIKEDSTDENYYVRMSHYGYVCSDFAEDVHNNAEAAGIRAAWVSISFKGDDEGHACNVFETVDSGLVYIDCTGGISVDQADAEPSPPSWDTVAYVEAGREYGLIAIDKAESLSYSFYEEYKQNWQEFKMLLNEYNEEVARYNQEVQGKVYREGSSELARMEAWKTEIDDRKQVLNQFGEELGEFWYEPKGIVEGMRVHWGKWAL
jgi:hypothetical protein